MEVRVDKAEGISVTRGPSASVRVTAAATLESVPRAIIKYIWFVHTLTLYVLLFYRNKFLNMMCCVSECSPSFILVSAAV
jgi:hypothetical protein